MTATHSSMSSMPKDAQKTAKPGVAVRAAVRQPERAVEDDHGHGRPWPINFGVLVFTAFSYGLGLYVYGRLHPPVTF